MTEECQHTNWDRAEVGVDPDGPGIFVYAYFCSDCNKEMAP